MTKIALTGATGNMGREALAQLMELNFVEKLKILVLPRKNGKRLALKWSKKYGNRLEVILGSVSSYSDCQKLVTGVDYVINLAAVIPPKSDASPYLAKACNVDGARNMVKAVEEQEKQPKFIHCSTVAVYGNRNYKHPWGRVGDPLLPSVYDCYASYKVQGERYVLDSNIDNWAVLRQTAMLHDKMLMDNMKDGLMFHTCFNTPLEWVTARDSGRLIVNIIKKDIEGQAKNVAGAFEVTETAAELMKERPDLRRIVLIDDVFTTGSTLMACFTALRSVFPPGVRISVATLGFVGGA